MPPAPTNDFHPVPPEPPLLLLLLLPLPLPLDGGGGKYVPASLLPDEEPESRGPASCAVGAVVVPASLTEFGVELEQANEITVRPIHPTICHFLMGRSVRSRSPLHHFPL